MDERRCKAIVFERAGGRCELSGATGSLSYHHLLKRSQGGRWTPENIVLVSGSGTTGAHGWIEAHPCDAEALGFHIRPWQKPGKVPIKTSHSGWVFLLSDGSVDEGRREEETGMATEGGNVPDGSPGVGEWETKNDNY